MTRNKDGIESKVGKRKDKRFRARVRITKAKTPNADPGSGLKRIRIHTGVYTYMKNEPTLTQGKPCCLVQVSMTSVTLLPTSPLLKSSPSRASQRF